MNLARQRSALASVLVAVLAIVTVAVGSTRRLSTAAGDGRGSAPSADGAGGVALVEGATADAVLDAEAIYTRSIVRNVNAAVFTALAIMAALALVSWLMRIDATASAPNPATVTLDVASGGAALLVLLPMAIALQVLVRFRREQGAKDPDDVIAHRQFWGKVAFVVAIASAFVGMLTFLHVFITNMEAGTIDYVQFFGVPAGAAAALLVAADAAAVSDLEAKRLSLDRARRDRTVKLLDKAIDRVPKGEVEHPWRRLITHSVLLGGVFVSTGAVVAHGLIGHLGSTLALVVLASLLTAFAVLTAVQVVPSVLRGDVLEALGLLVLPAIVAVAVMFTAATSAFSVTMGDEKDRYLLGLAYGLLVTVPSTLVVTGLSWPRQDRPSPMLAAARASLEAQKKRLEKAFREDEQAPWMTFAWAAIVASFLPPLAVPLAVIASWQRRGGARTRKMLILGMWIVVAVVAGAEVMALVLLPLFFPAA